MKLTGLVVSFIFVALQGNTQDTVRYDHSFKLPVKLNQPGYEKTVAQEPIEVHSFTLQVPDSCSTYIVIRSKSGNLKIIMDDGTVIKKRAKDKDVYVYSVIRDMFPGTRSFFIWTDAACRYTVNVSGISLH